MKNDSVSMTSGVIWKQMVAFAIPIFLGQLFQQLYNTADTLIVGKLLGHQALAAVSSSGNLIMLMVGFFNGMAMGGSVVASQAFGGGENERLSRTIHSTMALGLLISVILTLLGTWASPILLRWMGTPENVMPLSNAYFAVYFMGISGLIMYNLFSGIMRAVGDSKHPLYFLIASSITNIVLDLIFIAVFHWGVAGAAAATVLSQFLSCALSLKVLLTTKEAHRIHLKKIRLYPKETWQIIRYGIPTGVQNSIISLANVVVQSNINSFGEYAMAGCGAYSKLEGFAFLPIMSFNMATSTFVGQNIGAGEYERTLKGARFGILCAVIAAEIVGILIFLFAKPLIAMFDDDPLVVSFGAGRIYSNALFYFLLAYSNAISAVMRGGGKPAVPMWVMITFWCVVRVAFLMITAPLHNIQYVYWVYPLTWSLSGLFFAWYYPKKTWLYPKGKVPAAH